MKFPRSINRKNNTTKEGFHFKKKILCLLFLTLTAPLFPDSLENEINGLRKSEDLSLLKNDPLLAATALKYCKELLTYRSLAHKDVYGKGALERYRALGGTSLEVGEVIGAGSSEKKIIEAWLQSPPHKKVIRYSRWTHMGSGRVRVGDKILIVLLFTIKKTDNLLLTLKEQQAVLTGNSPGNHPLRIQIDSCLIPPVYRKKNGEFRFNIPGEIPPLILHLGYIDENNRFIPTDVLYPRKRVNLRENQK